MNRTTTARALDLLAGLSAAVDTDQFQSELLHQCCSLLEAERASIIEITATGATGGRGWPDQPTPPLRAIWDHRHEEHPAVVALRRPPVNCFRLREELSHRQLLQMPIYCEFMKPMGCRDQLAIALQANHHRLVSFAIVRVDAEFTESDQQLLYRMAGPLSHLYLSARRRDAEARTLTSREVQMLRLVADGHTDRAIARRLGISQRTVEKHLESVRAKFSASSRAAAVAAWLGW